MLRIFLILSIFLFTFISCQNSVVESYVYERDTPEWLKIKIDSILTSNRNYYHGTEVNRYKWNNNFLFEFHIPLSSCLLCELYYYDGAKTKFTDDNSVQDYWNNRTDKTFVWRYPDK